MNENIIRRTTALATSAVLLASMTVAIVAAPAAAKADKVTVCHKPDTAAEHTLTVARSAVDAHLDHGDYYGACAATDCTYVFPRDLADYKPNGVNKLDGNIGASEVVCGGPGDDVIQGWVRGTFRGGPGDDRVDGYVIAGPHDQPCGLVNATFVGGSGDDTVTRSTCYSTFNGGLGSDTVGLDVNHESTFRGGAGSDTVKRNVAWGSTFDGGAGNDTVKGVVVDAVFNGQAGNDWLGELGWWNWGGTFDGGPDADTLVRYVRGTCISIEAGQNSRCLP